MKSTGQPRLGVRPLVALGLVALALGAATGQAADKPTGYQTGEDPARLAQRCAALDDPQKREAMDGLLLELLYVCGRTDELGGESEEGLELRLESPLDSVDARVNDITGETGSRIQNETALAWNETTGTLCSGFNDSYSGVTLGQNWTGFSRSTDGGATWSDGGQLAPPAGQRSFGDPAIIWRRVDGKFYMSALHDSGGLGFWRSDDDCASFTWVGLGSPNSNDDKELLGVDNTPASPFYGRIYLSWTDFNIPGTAIVERHSTDGGATWTAQQTISFGGAPQGAWPAVGPDGKVYIAWVDRASNAVISQQVVRSTDGGATWAPIATQPAVNVVNPRASGPSASCGRTALNANIRYLPSPQIVVGPDNALHIVYSRDPNAQNVGDVVDVYYRRSTDSGATWSAEHRLNDDATESDQFFPTIAIGPANFVAAGWYDRRDDPANVMIEYYASVSSDGGVTWQPNVEISDVATPVVFGGGTALCYHGDYDTHVMTSDFIVRQWGDDRDDGSGANSNAYTDREAVSTDFLVLGSPSAQSICTPADAVYTIDVPQFEGFSESVTLAASGHPAGTTATFGANPLTPPDSTTLTIGNTGAASAGSYVVQVTGTSSPGAIVHDTNVSLAVYTAAPGAPTLLSPSDTEIDVARSPTLDWDDVAFAVDYFVEVATDAGFGSVVASATVPASTWVVEPPLGILTEYFWRVTANNPCGGTASGTFSFTTANPTVLLVDDDDNGPDVRATYETLLDGNGLVFDVWDTTGGEPTLVDLAPYQAVVWFTGDRFCSAGAPCAGPQTPAETALGQYLDTGRCLLVSSQDYLYDMGGPNHNVATPFMMSYLGLASGTSDEGDYTSVDGRNWYEALGNSALAYPYPDFSDILATNAGAQLAFEGNNGNDGAISKLGKIGGGSPFFTTFLAFGVETMPSAKRDELFAKLFLYCEAVRTMMIDDFESNSFVLWDLVGAD